MKQTVSTTLIIALATLSPGAIVQAQHVVPGNPNDLFNMPESGPPATPGGSTTTGPNYRNLAITPLPGSREEMDLVRPNEAQLPAPVIRPVPGKPLPSGRATR